MNFDLFKNKPPATGGGFLFQQQQGNKPPIAVKCHISEGFVRFFTLSRDEWTYAALIGRIREFQPHFNGIITANGCLCFFINQTNLIRNTNCIRI